MGHAVGDELLAAAAGRLEELKGSNGYVARLGGDEFVVLLHDVGSEENALAAARASTRASAGLTISPAAVQSGASIGIALGGSRGRVREAERDADQAMYQAKTGRKGVAVYCANMRNKASLTQNLQLELAGAAERAELELHFQPIVCLRRGVVTGAEALLRWKRPGGERMAAAEFIPLAEDAGLLSVIGE
ncbi:MAG: diguanylate cyclase [Bryobacterales bacterium]